MFIPYEKGVSKKLKMVASKYGFTTVFTKTKGLRGQIQTKQEYKMKTSGVVYEVDCNNCLKKYTGEAGGKLKERMKEHGEKSRKKKHNWPVTTCENHWPFPWVEELFIEKITEKRRKFKEAARITSYNKEKLMNKKGERKTISNL